MNAKPDDGGERRERREGRLWYGVGMEEHYEVSMFLHHEAELLDAQRYEDWLELMSEDVRYRMPVRLTVTRDEGSDRLGQMDHFDEDHYGLRMRVERLLGKHAWTEDPPSRTRRFVTNIRATDAGASGLRVRSYLLLFRSRLDVRPPEWLSAERDDVLRRCPDGFRIASRDIQVDEAVLRTENLAVLL
jgi:3-phenylpropionate/cinnamic acid dioxygenase small subunit